MTPALVAIVIATAHPNIAPARAQHLAEDIAAETETSEEVNALVATMEVESGMREEVETCAITGDHGRAISLYQMHRQWWEGHTRREVCTSNRLATRLALHTLHALGGDHGYWIDAFHLYVGGSTSRNDPRIARRRRLFEVLQAIESRRVRA